MGMLLNFRLKVALKRREQQAMNENPINKNYVKTMQKSVSCAIIPTFLSCDLVFLMCIALFVVRTMYANSQHFFHSIHHLAFPSFPSRSLPPSLSVSLSLFFSHCFCLNVVRRPKLHIVNSL